MNLKEAVNALLRRSYATCNLYVSLIQECSQSKSLLEGRQIHHHLRLGRFAKDRYLLNLLVEMYGSCGALDDALQTFNSITERRNVFSWTLLMNAFCKNEWFKQCKVVFMAMPQRDVVAWTAMLTAYALKGYLHEAVELFLDMPQRSVVSWNQMISVCAQNGRLDYAEMVFERIPERNSVTYNAIAHTHFGYMEKLLETDPEIMNVVSWNTVLMTLTQDHEVFHKVFRLFQSMQERNVVSWNTVLRASVYALQLEFAMFLFERMPQRDAFSWNVLIHGFAEGEDLESTLNLFMEMPERDVVAWTTVFAAYAHAGHMQLCKELFEKMPEWDIISWNAIITARSRSGDWQGAFSMFEIMPERSSSSWNGMLQQERSGTNLALCVDLFERLPQRTTASFTAMISLLAQSNRLEEARSTFNKMPERDTVAWNAMIMAYAEKQQGESSLELFNSMDLEGVKPDAITFACVVCACACIPTLTKGKLVHKEVIDANLESDLVVATAVMKMYGKCGSARDAKNLFEKINWEDAVAWTTMITAYAENGHLEDAIGMLYRMNLQGVKPDSITFVSVLSVCSHAGLIADALTFFSGLEVDYGVTILLEHVQCMIDLLGRSGLLKEAEEISKANDSFVGWMTLLASCTTHGSLEQASVAASRILSHSPTTSSAFQVLFKLNLLGTSMQRVTC